MPIIQPVISAIQQKLITDYINAYRNQNQAPPMVWDNTIAAFSQQWSYNLNLNNKFVHSNTDIYGENLAYFQGYGTDVVTLTTKAIESWYKEIALYDFKNPGFTEATGHFTALVWAASTHFGVGVSYNSSTSSAIIVLNTSPPGNVNGQYPQNVLPMVLTTGASPISHPLPSTPEIPSIPHELSIISNALYNLIHQLKTKQPSTVTVPTLNVIINELSSQEKVNTDIIDSLYYVYYMIQTNQPNLLIIKKMYNILYELLA
jgi:hypothetical protein